MTIYQDLELAVNRIKDINQEVGNELHNQLFHAGNSKWSVEDLSEYMKSDHDVVDMFDCDDILEEIRNFQDWVIGYFGEQDYEA